MKFTDLCAGFCDLGLIKSKLVLCGIFEVMGEFVTKEFGLELSDTTWLTKRPGSFKFYIGDTLFLQ